MWKLYCPGLLINLVLSGQPLDFMEMKWFSVRGIEILLFVFDKVKATCCQKEDKIKCYSLLVRRMTNILFAVNFLSERPSCTIIFKMLWYIIYLKLKVHGKKMSNNIAYKTMPHMLTRQRGFCNICCERTMLCLPWHCSIVALAPKPYSIEIQRTMLCLPWHYSTVAFAPTLQYSCTCPNTLAA